MDYLTSLLTTMILLALGCYILFAGRKYTGATLGIVGMTVAAKLLAVMVAELETGRELIETQEWTFVGIALFVGVLGVVIGRFIPRLGVFLIGFAAGASIALFLYDITSYLITDFVQQLESWVDWVTLAVIVVGGLFGIWLIRASKDEALILITMLIGVQFIQDVLGLDKSSSWTAIFILSLGLAGLLVQYAVYLREMEAVSELTAPEPLESSVAYFQDLQLED